MKGKVGCWLGIGVAGVFFTACGSSSSTTTLPATPTCTGSAETATEVDSVDSLSENVDLTCASVVNDMAWKNGATGSSCTQPADCTPVCCPCPNGTHHTLASWCNQGQCAAPGDVACMVNGTPGLVGCSN
jgi:hypothetical protein